VKYNPAGMAVRGVPRKQTTAGGFALDLSLFPPKPSGRSGERLVSPEISDADFEAHELLFALQKTLVSVAQELHAKRPVVADELLRGALMRIDDMRKYVAVMARVEVVPLVCSRCKVESTDDQTGTRMCHHCVATAYRKTVAG
jgi:hypothetical protein